MSWAVILALKVSFDAENPTEAKQVIWLNHLLEFPHQWQFELWLFGKNACLAMPIRSRDLLEIILHVLDRQVCLRERVLINDVWFECDPSGDRNAYQSSGNAQYWE